MPELPEVETVAQQLAQVIVGKKIQNIEVLKAKSWSGDKHVLEGETIQKISRRAKMIRFHFDKKLNVLIHLKMSGQLIYVDGQKRIGGGHPSADWVNALPSSHTRVIFTFTDGTHLFFNDQRIFGWMKIMSDEEIEKEFAKLGPDVIDSKVTVKYLVERCAKRNIPVKQFIMDSVIIAGVGNIYACDALNLARISPKRPARSLSRKEIHTLLKSMRSVIELGIKLSGATVHGKYVHVNGLSGGYQNVLRVYNKKGEPCPNCGSPIQKMTLGGRGTFYCPSCQK